MITCDSLQVFSTDCVSIEKQIVNDQCALEVNLIVDPDDCNALECRQQGTFVPSVNVVSASADSADFVLLGPPPLGVITNYNNQLPIQLIVQNPTDCCDMDVQIVFSGYMVFVGTDNGIHAVRVDGNANLELDGGALFNPASHNTGHVYGNTNDPLGEMALDIPTNGYTGIATIPAGGNITLDAWLDVDVLVNTGVGIDELYAEQAHLSAYGVCVAA